MSKVKTYAVNCNDAWLNTDGDDISESYVKYTDYMVLATKLELAEHACAALAAENAVMRAFGDKLYSMYKGLEASGGGFHDEQSIPYQQAALDAAISEFEKIKTPETDAFLAELLAHGVGLFAESQKEYVRKNRNELDSMTRAAYCGSAVDAERFAAQLRKGGEQK